MHRLAHRKRTIAWLMLCAIVVRAMFPQGFMPGTMQDGHAVIVCHGGPLKALISPAASEPATATDAGSTTSEDASGHCPFSDVVIGALPESIAAIPAAPQRFVVFTAPVPTRFVASGPPRQHSSRAPPFFS
jgi:hypothetical protein